MGAQRNCTYHRFVAVFGLSQSRVIKCKHKYVEFWEFAVFKAVIFTQLCREWKGAQRGTTLPGTETHPNGHCCHPGFPQLHQGYVMLPYMSIMLNAYLNEHSTMNVWQWTFSNEHLTTFKWVGLQLFFILYPGFRYELFCISKNFKTPHCVVHTTTEPETCHKWNEQVCVRSNAWEVTREK